MPETSVEAWLAPSLRVCEQDGDGNGNAGVTLEVINAGPAVWVVDQVPGWDPEALNAASVAVTLFRHATQGRYQGLAVEPSQQARFQPGPSFALHLAPSAGLQATWEAITRLTAAAESRIQDAALSLLSPTGQAVVACGQAASTVWDDVSDVDAGTPPDEALVTLYGGVSSARECAGAIETAQNEDRAAGRRLAISTDDLLIDSAANDTRVARSGFSLIAAKVQRGLGILVRAR